MKILTKLAIYILRKTKQSFIINCKFDRPVNVDVARDLYIYDNDFADGTTFVRDEYLMELRK